MERLRVVQAADFAAILGLTLAVGVVLVGRASAQVQVCDPFTTSTDTPFRWNLSPTTCGTITIGGGQMVMKQDNSCAGAGVAMIDSSEFHLQGDFDVSVDFDLVDFSVPGIGDRIANLTVNDRNGNFYATMERYDRVLGACNPGTANYKCYFTTSVNCDPTVHWLSTSDMTGKFRLTRVGSTVTGYYWSGGWVALNTTSLPVQDVSVKLVAGILNAGSAMEVHWSNFCATAANITAVPSVGPSEHAFHLEAVAPNPARMTSAVRFVTPAAGHVRVRVFDVAGRVVATPLDAFRPGGEQVVSWDAAFRHAGVYEVRVDFGDQTATARISVIH